MQKNGKFLLFPVDEFAAWLSITKFSRAVTLIQNHHTFAPAYAQFHGGNHFALLEGMEHFHVTERGFDEIAQNLTTFPDGQVAVCRSLDKIPAGIKGANRTGVCIEHLGNFDTGGDAMTDVHRLTIIRVNGLLCREFGLVPSTDTIVYHHWYDLSSGRRTDGNGTTKSCPGTAFFGGNSVTAAAAEFIPAVALAAGVQPAISNASDFRIGEVTAKGALNVRAGAETSFPVVKKLARGVQVRIYEESGDWCRIHHGEPQWASGRYLRRQGQKEG